MRRALIAALVLLLCLLGRGGDELEDVSLLRVIGVDARAPVRLTALTGGADHEDFETAGADIEEAQDALKALGEKRLELTHVSQLLLGPECAVEDTLTQAVLHRKSGYGATVWRTDGDAGELLTRAEGDPAARLKSLEENAGARAPTVLDALRALRETGEVTLPVAGLEDGELALTGYETIRRWEDGA